MIVRRRTLLLASLTTLVQSYVVPHSRITPVRYRAATGGGDGARLMWRPHQHRRSLFGVRPMSRRWRAAEYPINTDEFVNAYKKWQASKNNEINGDDARRDIQAFMTQEDLMEKWRPILQAEAEEANKMTLGGLRERLHVRRAAFGGRVSRCCRSSADSARATSSGTSSSRRSTRPATC